MNRYGLVIAIILIALGIGAERAEAGTFRVAEVWYEVWPLENNDEQIRVLVLARAKYSGKLDGDDNSWLIQTFLNDSIGGDLEDWNNPDWWGYGTNGTSIPYSGFEIHCDLACAADAAVSKCDAEENPVQYKGKAGVTIYHQFAPEIDIRYASTRETECLKYSIGGAVTDLPSGTLERSLILQNNGADDLVITKNGAFTFSRELIDGEPYAVTVRQHPVGKRCLVDFGSGSIEGADVTDIQVRCWNFCEARYSTVDPPGDWTTAGAPNCVTAGLVDKGDGTVADPRNNLLWTKDALYLAGNGGSPEDARGKCESLIFAGRSDWFLPDVAQLQTLLPPENCASFLNYCGGTFLGTGGEEGLHWTKSRVPWSACCPAGFGCYSCAWYVGLGQGTEFGNDCNYQGCSRERQRVDWMGVNLWLRVRCVTAIRWE